MIRRLFDGGPVGFEGEFNTLSGVTLDPRPHRPGGPPIWLGGRKKGAIRRAGRLADVWMPYMGFSLPRYTTVLSSARSRGGERPYRQAVSAALFAWIAVDPDADLAAQIGVATVSAAYQQDFSPRPTGYLLVGDPLNVAARIVDLPKLGSKRSFWYIAADNRFGPLFIGLSIPWPALFSRRDHALTPLVTVPAGAPRWVVGRQIL